MFTYRSKSKGKLTLKDVVPKSTIPMEFWTELHMNATSEWPSIVRKFNLAPAEIEEAAERLRKEKESRDSWAEMSVRNFKKY